MFTKSTDAGIVAKVLKGDRGAFRSLVERYAAVVQGVAYAHLRDAAEAEDVTQDVFLRLYQTIDKVAWQGFIGAWLIRVARNVSIDRLRKKGRDNLDVEKVNPAAISVMPNPAREELHKIILEQLEFLDPDERELLVLRYFLRRRVRDIAALLEISPGGAEKRLERAREALGRRLVHLLGDELDEFTERRTQEGRVARVMAAVVGVPVSWNTAAVLKTGGLAVLGASATKILVTVAAVAIVAATGLYWGWQRPAAKPSPGNASPVSRSLPKVKAPIPKRPGKSEAQAAQPAAAAQTPPDNTSADDAKASKERFYGDPPPVAFGVIWGMVFTEQRQPVPNARVKLERRGTFRQRYRVEVTIASTTTDDSGIFQFDRIPLGQADWERTLPRYEIWAENGNASASQQFLGVQMRRERYIELVLVPGAPLAGTVTDMGGRPVVNAMVGVAKSMATGDLQKIRNRDYTDSNGRFRLAYLFPGQYQIGVVAKGYAEYTSAWLETGNENVMIRLEQGLSIAGRVVDANTGAGLSEGLMAAFGRTERNTSDCALDPQGEFCVSGLKPDIYSLRLKGPEDDNSLYCLVEPAMPDLTRGRSVSGLILKASKGGVVTGRVLDSLSGEGLARASVQAVLVSEKPARQAACGETGAFRFEGLPPGQYSLKADCEGYQTKMASCELDAGKVREGIEIALEHWSGITGRVVDGNGNPVQGADVTAVSTEEMEQFASGISDDSGRFGLYFAIGTGTFPQAPRQVYVQAAKESNMSSRLGPISMDTSKEIVLKLAATGQIVGEVVDQNGDPISDAFVSAAPKDGALLRLRDDYFEWDNRSHQNADESRVHTNVNGGYSLPPLLPGEYELRAYMESSPFRQATTSVDVTLDEGQVLDMPLTIDTGLFGTVEGRVLIDGQPWPGQRVSASSEEWAQVFLWACTDNGGMYRIDHVSPGRVDVQLGYQAPFSSTRNNLYKDVYVDVSPGGTATADFEVQTALAYVEGVVTTNGVPEYFALVDLKRADSNDPQSQVFTDSQGYYRLGVTEGTYTVSVSRSWLASPEQVLTTENYTTVQLATGQTLRLDISFAGGIIQGTLDGLTPEERGVVALFPGDTPIPPMTPDGIAGLMDRSLRYSELPGNGPFRLEGVDPGNYLLGAAAIPKDAPLDVAALAQARVALAVVDVKAGETVTVSLVIQ
jgi:RNA polymerase sigma-70 factor (ECF subfamily)